MASLQFRPYRTAALTSLALTAFAANSLLCRLALSLPSIDAASFSLIRLVSGALVLWVTMLFTNKNVVNVSITRIAGNWLSALMLFVYMVAFSFAYIHLSAGVGALILFGAVQATMLLASIISGERPSPMEWLGLLLAIAGLIYLVSPGLASPPIFSAIFMLIAGIAWGLYSLLGHHVTEPLAMTTGNFIRATPLAIIAFLLTYQNMHISATGILLAIASGAIASGLGYAVWYAALRELTTTRAATLQLSVPVIAGIGGVLFLAEAISLHFFVAACMILGGIAVAIVGKNLL